MFIDAKNALLAAGAHRRTMPFLVAVEARHGQNEPWTREAWGNSTEYLADCFNDAKVLWGRGRARIINAETGDVIFLG